MPNVRSLSLRERLKVPEENNAEHQHELVASYERMGDLHLALGQSDEASAAYDRALKICLWLVSTAPERTDFQRALGVIHSRIGDLHYAL